MFLFSLKYLCLYNGWKTTFFSSFHLCSPNIANNIGFYEREMSERDEKCENERTTTRRLTLSLNGCRWSCNFDFVEMLAEDFRRDCRGLLVHILLVLGLTLENLMDLWCHDSCLVFLFWLNFLSFFSFFSLFCLAHFELAKTPKIG